VLYLVTGTRPVAALDLVRAGCPAEGPGLGYLSQYDSNPPLSAGWWAADNACVIAGPEGTPLLNPAWDERRWFGMLERHVDKAGRCLFAVLPDVVGDHAATLARSLPYVDRVRELGYRPAFAMQNGSEDDRAIPWDAFDVVFLAGDTAWKTGRPAHLVATRGLEHGKWVHMGRVNSLRRLRIAARMGCDSVDGTFLKHGPDVNLPQLLSWLDVLATRPYLPLARGTAS
jgi:hypothetical protein